MSPASAPNASLGVAIVGARGRMGSFADQLLVQHADFEVLARPTRGEPLDVVLSASGAQLGLDLSVAGAGFEHGLCMLRCGLRPVIGTSGVSSEELFELDREARERRLGGLLVPNFSLGMWLLQEAASRAALHFPEAAIVERHQREKRDAPSASALDTVRRMRAARGATPTEIPIHALRLGASGAEQEVTLVGPGEVLRLSHAVTGREAYAAGLIASLRYAAAASTVGVGSGVGLAFGLALAD